MATTFIYALADPRTFEVRYIGKADDPYRRYCEHLVDKRKTHKVCWIQSLLKMGLLPIRQILEECDKTEWQQKECDWIAFEKRIGCDLTNHSRGGTGGSVKGRKTSWKGGHHSEETKKMFSEMRKGKPSTKKGCRLSLETRQKISKSLMGRPSWNKGKPMSDKTREKLSFSTKRYFALHGHPFKGKHHSEKTREKISVALAGNVLPFEQRLKISQSMMGKNTGKRSEETKQKIRDAMKLRKAG